MAGNSAEMKVKATMDNSDLKKKSKESKDALKDFAKVGEDAVSSLGSAFGVNTGKIEQMMSAVRGLGENLSQSANTGTKALGDLLKGVNGLAAGIAGIGIGALVAGFKALKDEAENFKGTLEGAYIESSTAAYVDTYKQIIHDYVSAVGSAAAEAEASAKKTGMTFGASLKAYFATGAYAAAFEPGIAASNQALDEYTKLIAKADAKATEAARINEEIFNLQREISDSAEKWAKLELDIAENKRIAYDSTVDISERQEALLKTIEKIKERYGEEADIQARLAKLQTDYNALASSPIEDIDKENQLRAQTLRTAAAMQDKLRELLRRQKSITEEAQKEADAREKMAQSRASLQSWIDQSAISTSVMTSGASVKLPVKLKVERDPNIYLENWWKTVTANLGDVGKLHVAFDPDDLLTIRDNMVNISSEIQQLMISSFDVIGSSIGNLIGDLATGGDAWGNFTNSAISAFADMAIAIGKMAIAIGVASSGIKAALELNPVAAIAGGTALVALGMAVKTGLNNIAQGNYSTASAVASSSGNYGGSSSFGSDYENREITVKVTGTLRAEGNQLLTVIENENNRRSKTT